MGIKERKDQEKEKMRKLILDAAGEIFAGEGYENASMRKIADKIEYSSTTIYLYFKDKRELFNSLIQNIFGEFLKLIEESTADYREDPEKAIKKGMRTYVDFGLKYPNHYKVAFMTDTKVSPENYQREDDIGQMALNNLRTLIQECVKQNVFPELDIELTTQLLWTINHGVTSLLITYPNYPWVDKEKLICGTIETAIKGLKE